MILFLNMRSKSKLLKILFLVFSGYTLYFFLVWFVLAFFVKPRLHSYSSYESMYNWDLPAHPRGDFDKDGKEDLISFTGCAFLSSVSVEQIPEENRCAATRISSFVSSTINAEEIGQKYTITEEYDLDLKFFATGIHHSYLEQKENSNWHIAIKDTSGLRRYVIGEDGLLKEIPVSVLYRIDEMLYSLSLLFNILVLPTVPIFYVLPPMLLGVSVMYPVFPLFVLICMTSLFYLWWRKNAQSQQG